MIFRRIILSLLAVVPLVTSAENRGWVVTAQDTTEVYFAACMANGQIGAVVGRQPFEFGQVILGSAYSRGRADAVSCILEGINPLGLSMTTDSRDLVPSDIRRRSQQIDLRHALHTTRFETDAAEVVCRVRALRNMPYALMTEVEVTAKRDAELLFTNRHRVPENFADPLCEVRSVQSEDGGYYPVQRTSASYNDGRDRIAASSIFLCDEGCEQVAPQEVKLSLRRGAKGRFAVVGVICTTADFDDPWNESERQAMYAVREGIDHLTAAHERLWARLWQSDIEIEGDEQTQLDVRFAIFNLYSSVREGSRRSIPPMGLSAQGYNGHIFWDSEIWMYPALLVLHPQLARQMLDYRIDWLDAARRRAYAHGYRGAMYPWEGDYCGEESTPTFALTGPLEHHITADIAIAAWNYYCVTHDKEWLQREGYPLLREGARFWCDRVTANDDGSYSIRNVIGANEYAVGVTDNAFTNGSARRALEYAAAAAKVCGERADPQWTKVAQGLRICRFDDGTTREHADYNGEQIKQADANLLGYPLGIVTDRRALLRDMNYYASRIDPRHGPAMSYSVFAVQYVRLGMREKAWEMFRRSFEPNLRPPLRVFAETPTSGNPYFMTGAGGFLQALLFGFGGLEIEAGGVRQRTTMLPEQWKSLTIKIDGKTYSVKK